MKLLHEGASAASLRVVRFGVFGLWIVKVAGEPTARLGELPLWFFQRVGVLSLLPPGAWRWVHTPAALTGIRIVTLVCLSLSLGGRWRTPAALTSCLLLTVHESLLRGLGHVNHDELALLYAAFILAVYPLVAALARRTSRRASQVDRSDAPIVLITGVFLFTYALTGLSRLVLWTPFVFHPNMVTSWILANAYQPSYYRWQAGQHVMDLPFWGRGVLAGGLLLATLFELLAPCCLFSRRFRRLFLVVMASMHVLVYFSMNILFWENLALLFLLLDIEPLIRSIHSRMEHWRGTRNRRSGADSERLMNNPG